MRGGLSIVVLPWESQVEFERRAGRAWVFIRQVRAERITVLPLPNLGIVTRPRDRPRRSQMIGIN